jgi:hypothetical protein
VLDQQLVVLAPPLVPLIGGRQRRAQPVARHPASVPVERSSAKTLLPEGGGGDVREDKLQAEGRCGDVGAGCGDGRGLGARGVGGRGRNLEVHVGQGRGAGCGAHVSPPARRSHSHASTHSHQRPRPAAAPA